MTCQSRTWIVVVLAALMLVVPVNAFPYGCGLDDLCCHHNRKADAYHIQRGSLVRQQFRSKADVLKLLRNANPMLASPPSAIAPISGKPRIIDGDTIEVAGQRIRLHGIDAPESGQTCNWPDKVIPCGNIAANTLTGTVAGQTVRCETRGKNRYGRWIATCFAGDVDIAQNVVYTGWALAYRKYSKDYVAADDAGRKAGRGLWRGKFIAPWDWRRGKRLPSVKDNRLCRIKGNIGKRGARVFHLPGGAHYSRTRINEGRGERWFCTEVEARAASWRRSKR